MTKRNANREISSRISLPSTTRNAQAAPKPLSAIPLHDRIIVRRMEASNRTASGIIVPDSAREKPQEGVVLSVGTGRLENGQRTPLAVKVGDRILFGKYSGSEVMIEEQEVVIMREEEVFCILP